MIPMYSLSALLLLFVAACLAETISLRRDRITDLSTVDGRQKRASVLPPVESSVEDELHVLDIVLVASVDGKFHALNRSSGQPLWSMASTSAAPGAVPSTLGPLVSTDHVEHDPDVTDDDTLNQELYIIEPQSGDIYVMNTPTSPLQRLDFSMPQLVDMSPFSFSEADDRRLFVGKKETSLLLIELETGKVKATLNSECPWDPFENLSETDPSDLDLDELEGATPPRKTEVYIGRTDYHISIHTRPLNPSSRKPPVQNLSFSTYGPNNQDNALQTMYRRTVDDAYIQSLPNGEILCFKAHRMDDSDPLTSQNPIIWGHTFPRPIVAVFDVVQTVGRQQPFVLLQPRPRLEEVLSFRDLMAAANQDRLPHINAAYVGLVEETGSLFAMSPDRFPLVVFREADVESGGRFIDASVDDGDGGALPVDVDSVTRLRKLKEMCTRDPFDRRCLTGIRQLEESSRWRRHNLIDGVPSVPGRPEEPDVHAFNETSTALRGNESSLLRPWIWVSEGGSGSPLTLGASADMFWGITSCILALTYWAVWWVAKKSRAKRMAQRLVADVKEPTQSNSTVGLADGSVKQPEPAQADSLSIQPSGNSPLIPNGYPPIHSQSTKELPDLPPEIQPIPSPNLVSPEPADDAMDGEETDRDADANATPVKKKGLRRRRGRGGKGKKGAALNGAAEGEGPEAAGQEISANGNGTDVKDPVGIPPISALVPPTPPPSVSQAPSLVVSDTILGFGSHGTVVFQGSLQGRAVAVKRLLQDFVTLASREVSILQESDDHPNVIRYYYQEAHANFLYIALELCPASLADIIESPDQFRAISVAFDPKRALRQIASGLRHLHGLKIVHRDIKPQNILISSAKSRGGSGHRMLISDFGLCKKLDVDQTSFLPTAHGAMAAGTVGWRAPEILRGEVKLDETIGDDQSQSSRGSVANESTPTGKPTRLTKSVDIFALGCLFYYTLTNGSHPFGDRFEREVNILKNARCLDGLERFGEEGSEAVDLISAMLHPEAASRPDTTTCLLHPFFWDPGRRLNFLQDVSDRFEIMCRDPRDPNLVTLETDAFSIVGHDWHARLDKVFIENLGKFRKYDGRSVQDLLRALRNKKNHYQDLPDNVKRHLGPMPEGFLSYFTRRFPRLFLHVHSVIATTALHQESMFRSYFELSSDS